MKVSIGNETYLVHWETRTFSPEQGRHTDLELEATDCIIRKSQGEDLIEISRGHASQTSSDQSNSVTGRRVSFLKAISDFDRPIRKALGDEYNKNCRVVSNTASQKNRKLRRRIAELTVQLAEVKNAEEVMA